MHKKARLRKRGQFVLVRLILKMGNVLTKEANINTNLQRVTEFYKEQSQQIQLAQKLKVQEQQKQDIFANIQTINRDWRGEIPTFQEVSNPFI